MNPFDERVEPISFAAWQEGYGARDQEVAALLNLLEKADALLLACRTLDLTQIGQKADAYSAAKEGAGYGRV
jgi:hypothetical protein